MTNKSRWCNNCDHELGSPDCPIGGRRVGVAECKCAYCYTERWKLQQDDKEADMVDEVDDVMNAVFGKVRCPATVVAVLGLPKPVTLPCSSFVGHRGGHYYMIAWGLSADV